MKIFFVAVCLAIINFCNAQVDHWESVVLEGDMFRYQVPTSTITGWFQSDFDDQTWEISTSGFGYGDNDDATVLERTLTVYLRHDFDIVAVDDIENLILDMDFDDGFIAYLNGVEIARYLVSGELPSFDQPADGLHEAALYQGSNPERFEIDKSLLVNGQNVIAIAIHNESLTSSDMTGIPTLSVGLRSSDRFYRDTPDWFDESSLSDFSSSNLPILIIETENSQNILDLSRVEATMWVLNTESDQRNYVENKNNVDFQNFKGKITIETRGSTSQTLPKKPYGFTTYNNGGIKENVSLLGMPKENDWILNSLAFDPSLIRDYLTYNLFQRMGHYAAKGVFCELMVNGEYKGLYILQEKLKADKNRIDINQIAAEDNEFPKLSGGYVTKADKSNGDAVAWSMTSYSGGNIEFIHDHPKPEEATIQQSEYLEGLFKSLEILAKNDNSDIRNGFPSIIDIPSFVDFILISELSANVDAYQFSTYFHKDRNGKLRAGPIWDCNLTYGNDLFEFGFDRSKVDLWQFFHDNMGAMFWKDLFDNNVFRCHLSKRWFELTSENGVLNQNNIDPFIDEIVNTITESVQREETKWGRVGNLDNNIADLKTFLKARTTWMTAELASTMDLCNNPLIPELKITAINYHPEAIDNFDESDLEFLRISNTGNVTIDLTGIYFGGMGFVYQFPNGAILNPGEEVYLANETNQFASFYGFNPYDEFSRSLDNSGQRLTILDAFGNLIDEVEYDDKAPWPIEADGGGFFLEVSDYQINNDLPENWKASEYKITALTAGEPIEPILNIYPNPFDTKISISSKSRMNEIFIYTADGKKIYSQSGSEKLYSIELHNITPGIYYLHIKMDHGIITRKLIKP